MTKQTFEQRHPYATVATTFAATLAALHWQQTALLYAGVGAASLFSAIHSHLERKPQTRTENFINVGGGTATEREVIVTDEEGNTVKSLWPGIAPSYPGIGDSLKTVGLYAAAAFTATVAYSVYAGYGQEALKFALREAFKTPLDLRGATAVVTGTVLAVEAFFAIVHAVGSCRTHD
jgi:hypothetical protein